MARLPKFLNMSAAGRVRLALPTARLVIIAFSFTLAAVGMGAFVATLPSASATDSVVDGAAASPDAAGDDAQRPDPTLQDDAAQDAAPAEEGDVASGDPSAAAGSYSAPGGTLVAPVTSGSAAAAPSGTSSSSGAAVDYVLAREARLAGPRVSTPASSALADPAPGERDLPRERPVPSLGLLRVAGGYVTGSIRWVDPAGEGCVVGSLATGATDPPTCRRTSLLGACACGARTTPGGPWTWGPPTAAGPPPQAASACGWSPAYAARWGRPTSSRWVRARRSSWWRGCRARTPA